MPVTLAVTAAQVGATAAVFLVGVALLEVWRDHRRRRAFASLEFYRNVLDSVQVERVLILTKFGHEAISREDAEKYRRAITQAGGDEDDAAMGLAIARYLNGLERLAVGANLGVLDEKILKRLARYRFVKAKTQFAEYLKETRDQPESGRVYEEFIEMAKRWDLDEPNTGGAGWI